MHQAVGMLSSRKTEMPLESEDVETLPPSSPTTAKLRNLGPHRPRGLYRSCDNLVLGDCRSRRPRASLLPSKERRIASGVSAYSRWQSNSSGKKKLWQVKRKESQKHLGV